MSDKITTLIVTYRRPKFLKRAVLSVLQQTYKDLKVCVFDDASGDSTSEIMSELVKRDSRVKYHCHSTNMGSIPNFKYAFSTVDTPYFSILSDDDFLAEDFYEDAINILDNHPEIQFVILNTLLVDENQNLISKGFLETGELIFYCDNNRFDVFRSGKIPTSWGAMVFRKELARIHVDMDDRFDKYADGRFLLNASALYNYAHLSKVGAFFTYHKGSFSASSNNFDLVHYAVIMSRYVELYNDPRLDSFIKERVFLELSKMIKDNYYGSWRPLREAIVRAIKNICNATENSGIGERDIEDSKKAGLVRTSLILHLIYHNQIINKLIRLVFFRHVVDHTNKYQSKMAALQNGVYKDLFESIKKIGDEF